MVLKHKSSVILFDSIRFYLALVFMIYAKNKLMHDQFYIDPLLLDARLKDLPLLSILWFVFGHEPFNYFIGISQLITAFMLCFRRTALWGTLMFLVIILNILIIDLTVMQGWVKLKMVSKVVFLLCLALGLLYYYKKEIVRIFRETLQKVNVPTIHIRTIILIPILMITLNCLSITPKYLYLLLDDPDQIYTVLKLDLKDSYESYKVLVDRYFNQ